MGIKVLEGGPDGAVRMHVPNKSIDWIWKDKCCFVIGWLYFKMISISECFFF